MSIGGQHLVVPGDTVLLEPGSLMVCLFPGNYFTLVHRVKDCFKTATLEATTRQSAESLNG